MLIACLPMFVNGMDANRANLRAAEAYLIDAQNAPTLQAARLAIAGAFNCARAMPSPPPVRLLSELSGLTVEIADLAANVYCCASDAAKHGRAMARKQEDLFLFASYHNEAIAHYETACAWRAIAAALHLLAAY